MSGGEIYGNTAADVYLISSSGNFTLSGTGKIGGVGDTTGLYIVNTYIVYGDDGWNDNDLVRLLLNPRVT